MRVVGFRIDRKTLASQAGLAAVVGRQDFGQGYAPSAYSGPGSAGTPGNLVGTW
jgi:hypothetical protein